MVLSSKNIAFCAVVITAFTAVMPKAEARDEIRIVGSSTVYPFSTRVAEEFGQTTRFKTPVVESTGTGGGFKIFCQGTGADTPDISNASRQIKKAEVETCAKNGVTDITEVKIGYDGIVLANSKAAPRMNITLQQLYLALAKDIPDGKGGFKPNPHVRWSDVDPSLPSVKIEVLGPPPTSGTRDAFDEVAMQGGCDTIPVLADLKKTDEAKHNAACQALREDGAYIEAGENDVLIVRKLEVTKSAFGIFGYSYLEQSGDKIQGSLINGVNPDYDNVASGKYPISRPLFIYVKKVHVGTISGIREFLAEFTSEKAWGPDGYLSEKGLITLPDDERARQARAAHELPNNVR